ncbi:Holliday junction ATP-dependent DNA helicase RuvA [hydrothermal vent metagenome]|uniref:Holliday junction ATP-dependent DNA helicase RuvA n=1 Tax=hydrothermal vent metagenome TaxID=652676 RepID=A0A3B1A6M6_9ZZZZ
MIETDRLISPASAPSDNAEEVLDRAIRPKTLADYVGQPVVVEMRDRVKDWQGVSLSPDAVTRALEPAVDALKDAISALVALGYKPQEARR